MFLTDLIPRRGYARRSSGAVIPYMSCPELGGWDRSQPPPLLYDAGKALALTDEPFAKCRPPRFVGVHPPLWEDGQDVGTYKVASGFSHVSGSMSLRCSGYKDGREWYGAVPQMTCEETGFHSCEIQGLAFQGGLEPAPWETGELGSLSFAYRTNQGWPLSKQDPAARAGLMGALRAEVWFQNYGGLLYLDEGRTDYRAGKLVLMNNLRHRILEDKKLGIDVYLYMQVQDIDKGTGSGLLRPEEFDTMWAGAKSALDPIVSSTFSGIPTVSFGNVQRPAAFKIQFKWRGQVMYRGGLGNRIANPTMEPLHDLLKRELDDEGADSLSYSLKFAWAAPKCKRGHYQVGDGCLACPAEHYYELDGGVKTTGVNDPPHPCKPCVGCDYNCECEYRRHCVIAPFPR